MRIHHRAEWLESWAEVHRNALLIPSGAQRKVSFLLADRCLDPFSKSRGRLEEMGGLRSLFCPTLLAKCMKQIEPLLEALPVVRQLACAVYVVVGIRET